MRRVTGIGGVFFKARDAATLRDWYRRHLGIDVQDWGGAALRWADDANPGFVKVILLRIFVNGLIGMVPIVGFFYSLVDIVFIFREDQRCLHDLIAGTKVVKA